MANNELHMTVGPLLGETLLDIAQNNICKGEIEKGIDTYVKSLIGFTKEYALMLLKNEAVLVTDEDGTSVSLTDDAEVIKENAHRIYNWNYIIEKKISDIKRNLEAIDVAKREFHKYYQGDIENYSIIDMMLRYFSSDQLKQIGLHTIAARILGSPDGKICDKGNSNPTSVWEKVENKIEFSQEYGDPEYDADIARYELVLYFTVRYNKLIKMLHKEYMAFENLYFFLTENGFVTRPNMIELMLENAITTLMEFTDTGKGYYHPLCNEGLYRYKEQLHDDLLKTKIGMEYAKNGIIEKNIMDGYDAGWLSPDGEFYGANGETSALLHMNLAEQIFNAPTNKYAVRMMNDGVTIYSSDQPDYWLEKNGWIKMHHNEIYGSFIGERDPSKRTKDFPYHYCPTEIQVKMICNYADKFYGGKFVTEPSCIGFKKDPEVTTYKVRQMDEFKLHETFGR
jgi:hypothetical protein